jgi:hypothetical protein
MNQAANGDKKKAPYPFELNPFIAPYPFELNPSTQATERERERERAVPKQRQIWNVR